MRKVPDFLIVDLKLWGPDTFTKCESWPRQTKVTRDPLDTVADFGEKKSSLSEMDVPAAANGTPATADAATTAAVSRRERLVIRSSSAASGADTSTGCE